MALPKSEDKKKAIISATIKGVAETGVNTSTSGIAKSANVAEGTVFKYFPTKDILLNEAYMAIKGEMAEILMNSLSDKDIKIQLKSFWNSYVLWGAENPEKYDAMVRLSVSEKITPENRKISSEMFSPFHNLMGNLCKDRTLNGEYAFHSAVLSSLADTTIKFMIQHPENPGEYSEAGFRALWSAVSSI